MLAIVDDEGQPKMNATVQKKMSSPKAVATPVITILSPPTTQPGARPLAFCRVGFKINERPCMYMYTRSDDLFGTFLQDSGAQSCYVFTNTTRSTMLFFEGNFAEKSMMVTDIHHHVLADTSPVEASADTERTYYRLRVVPGADVGLIVCCLLSIAYLESE